MQQLKMRLAVTACRQHRKEREPDSGLSQGTIWIRRSLLDESSVRSTIRGVGVA
jgi:hypothetical protein